MDRQPERDTISMPRVAEQMLPAWPPMDGVGDMPLAGVPGRMSGGPIST